MGVKSGDSELKPTLKIQTPSAKIALARANLNKFKVKLKLN